MSDITIGQMTELDRAIQGSDVFALESGGVSYKISAQALKKSIGGATLTAKTITANGTYDPADDGADGYSGVTADVPNTYAAGDEGKVVANGALVSQTARAGEITANGTYDTTLNNSVTVDVSGGGGSIPTYTQAQWDALTTEQKQALGFAVIVTAESGFKRGDYVYGGDYVPFAAYLPNSDPTLVKCIATWDNFRPNSLSWGDGEAPIQMTSACPQYQSEDAVFFNAASAANAIGFDLGGETADFTVYVVAKGVYYGSDANLLMGSVYQYSTGKMISIYHQNGEIWRTTIYSSDTDLIDTHGDYVAVAIRSNGMSASWFAYGGTPRLNVAYDRHGQRFTFGGSGSNYLTNLAAKFVGYIAGAESDADIAANLANLAEVYNLS